MARKVFVSSDIAHDEKLLDVAESEPSAALLWPWLLTAFDDWGRARAEPRRLKVQIFPGNDLVTVDLISRTLALLRDASLIDLYERDGGHYMAIDPETWFSWQTHIRKEKRGDDSGSKHPPPPKPPGQRVEAREESRDSATEREESRDRTPSPSPSPSSPLPSVEVADESLVLDEERSDPETGLEVWVDAEGKQRQRIDGLWDAAVEIWGTPKTKQEHGRRNKEIKALRDARVSPELLQPLFAKASTRWNNRAQLNGILTNLGDLLEGIDVTPQDVKQYHAAMQRARRRKEITG